jgi:hypothetical protein
MTDLGGEVPKPLVQAWTLHRGTCDRSFVCSVLTKREFTEGFIQAFQCGIVALAISNFSLRHGGRRKEMLRGGRLGRASGLGGFVRQQCIGNIDSELLVFIRH